MCGRAYSTYTDEELYARYLNKKRIKIPSFKPNYNMSPTHEVLTLRMGEENLEFDFMRWQYVPPWEPEFKTKLSTINAKSETVFESKLYKGAIIKRRCIVPLSGFIEWKREGETKRPFCIHLKDGPIMSVAGIWGIWGSGKDEKHSFSILTTKANSFMAKIHDRMPVILSSEQEEEWLDPKCDTETKLLKLMKPSPSKLLSAYEISKMINSPKNNRPEVLNPLLGTD